MLPEVRKQNPKRRHRSTRTRNTQEPGKITSTHEPKKQEDHPASEPREKPQNRTRTKKKFQLVLFFFHPLQFLGRVFALWFLALAGAFGSRNGDFTRLSLGSASRPSSSVNLTGGYVWTVSEVLLDLGGQRLRLDRDRGASGPQQHVLAVLPDVLLLSATQLIERSLDHLLRNKAGQNGFSQP